ncbi:hypothetical protein [Micromonospora sp. b486]|uniref:hypothetical protein n=1 Tax=Micromonospora sp. b486 TaxID=3053986 RepID=UPI00259CEF48|nr:hypothetical protein [Micromonospora sp. b486]MDM4781433.1 hypothetical protein [Micromonospora sp. b486]
MLVVPAASPADLTRGVHVAVVDAGERKPRPLVHLFGRLLRDDPDLSAQPLSELTIGRRSPSTSGPEVSTPH